MRFSAEGLTYPAALALIAELRANNIEANITAGGVSIYPEPDLISQAETICKKHNASFRAGYTEHQESVMLQSDSGWKTCEKVTNDSNAAYQEFT